MNNEKSDIEMNNPDSEKDTKDIVEEVLNEKKAADAEKPDKPEKKKSMIKRNPRRLTS